MDNVIRWQGRDVVERRAVNMGKADSDLTVDDVIAIYMEPGSALRLPHFPTIVVCSQCSGMRGIYVSGRSVNNPTLAYHVALVEFGYRSLAKFDNSAPFGPCGCLERLAQLKLELPDIIVEDSGWKQVDSSIPHRGIYNYERNLVLRRDATEDELKVFAEWLHKDNCPGWTSVVIRKAGFRCYVAHTTHDSSD